MVAPQPQGEQAPPRPVPSLTWHTAHVVNRNAHTDGARPDFVLDRLEQAREGRRPVLLFVVTSSEDRRFDLARQTATEIEEALWRTFDVATQLQHFDLIRVDLANLDRDILRKYRITANAAPQIILYDFELRHLWGVVGAPNEEFLVTQLERARLHCTALAERVDRATRTRR